MARQVYISARLSPEHWVRILDVARSERLSGHRALSLVVERGLQGSGVVEQMRALSGERLASGVERELKEALRS